MDILFLASVGLLILLAGSAALLAVMIVRFVQARGRRAVNGAWVSSPRALGIAGGVAAILISAVLSVNVMEVALVVFNLGGFAGGAAGIVGGAIVRKHRKAAGVLMLAGGGAALFTLFGPMLMVTGGVLALVPAKSVKYAELQGHQYEP
jgi:hypothetical protein